MKLMRKICLKGIRSYRTSTQHCLESLKKYDPESVLQLPFWPENAQSAFVAIQAFHAELQLIPFSVASGKPLIAKIRYQWWRDAIETCYQSLHSVNHEESHVANFSNQIPSNHPLIQILKIAIQKHNLSKYYFTRIINGLESHYLEPRFSSTNELVKFSQSTTYSNLSLLLQVLNTTRKKRSKNEISLATIDHSLSHLSNFLTIVKLIKQIPNYIKNRQVNFIPIELMECRDEDLFRLFNSSGSSKLYQQVTTLKSDDKNPLELIQNTFFNLVFLAYSELIATREVLNLDPSHSHSHNHDHHHHHLNHIQNRHLLKISLPDPFLTPLFLTATPAKNQIKKLEKLFINLNNNMKNKENQNEIILNQFRLISKKSDWKLPFQIYFDFFLNKF